MATTPREQIGMDDEWLRDSEFEKLLEERETLKDKKSAATKAYATVDEKAKARVLTLEMGPEAEVRCGRFILSKPNLGGKPVAFTPETKPRATIRLAKTTG
jgi:phosphoenolpyruvate synthase/pyruvate phosphate dikinase